ncbi:MAG: hypothetical protein ACRD3I_04950 [Terriglobales bacterium]
MALCHAHTTKAKKPCGRQAVKGARVCYVHGGAAPQVREAARLRLLQATDPAAAELVRQVKAKKLAAVDRRQAAVAILDRAGLGPSSSTEVRATVQATYTLQELLVELHRVEISASVPNGGEQAAIEPGATEAQQRPAG